MIEIQQMAFVRFEDGTIAERWFLPDNLSLLHRIEIVDPVSDESSLELVDALRILILDDGELVLWSDIISWLPVLEGLRFEPFLDRGLWSEQRKASTYG